MAIRPPWNESPYFHDAGPGRLRIRQEDVIVAVRRPDMALLSALGSLTGPPSMQRFLEIWSAVEQVPGGENRVELLPEIDRLGMQKARVHWTVGSAEERTCRRALQIVLAELERLEPGISDAQLDEADPWPAQLIGNWHHEGTTRMHCDPGLGTVDSDCRVHGVENLYVAGSSVFPLSGSTFPTVTILQLSLRLVDHLSQRLRT
jgi:choline dehydrogenase-like flavoprotein